MVIIAIQISGAVVENDAGLVYKTNDVGHWARHGMMFKLNDNDISFIRMLLEGFFYGLYSGVFAMYLQCRALKKDTNNAQNTIIFYCICALYALSAPVFVCNATYYIFGVLRKPMDWALPLAFIQCTTFACCDFIAQLILIYRCWIVWGRNIHVVIIPSILAFAFLGTWLAYGDSTFILSDELVTFEWGPSVLLTSLAMSLTVNALVTSLIVFRIFSVFREVREASDGQVLGATGGNKLRGIIFILIESGMALFSIQLARAVATIMETDAAYRTVMITASIHGMLNGITPTIILVRTSMGLSFDDEKSLEEFAIESLRFAPDHQNSMEETGSTSIVGQDSRNNDDIGIQRSNDIEVVDR